MKSIKWIDRLITEKKLPSDRQAALQLGMSPALLSQHRNGKAVTLDDKYAYRLEELLDLPHGKIVLDQHAEREKDPNISAMWRRLAGTAASVAAAFIISSVIFTPTVQAVDAKNLLNQTNNANRNTPSLYIM